MLAKWAKQRGLKEALGPSRAEWFKKQYEKMNADPQQILQAMLTQKSAGQQTFIDLEKLQKKSLSFKAKPKPKPKPSLLQRPPAPKPKPKAAAPKPHFSASTPAPKGKAPKKLKFKTKDTNYDYDKNWEKLGYETKASTARSKQRRCRLVW